MRDIGFAKLFPNANNVDRIVDKIEVILSSEQILHHNSINVEPITPDPLPELPEHDDRPDDQAAVQATEDMPYESSPEPVTPLEVFFKVDPKLMNSDVWPLIKSCEERR